MATPLVAPVAANKNTTFRGLVPVPAAHHIDAHRRLAIHAVIDSLEQMVEPAQVKCIRSSAASLVNCASPA